ncbi:MAG: hypothetical protein ACYCW6_23020 [Candidatus Xenobia bacterium]
MTSPPLAEGWPLRNPSQLAQLLIAARTGIQISALKQWLSPGIIASIAFNRIFREESGTVRIFTSPGPWRLRVDGKGELILRSMPDRLQLEGYWLPRRLRIEETLTSCCVETVRIAVYPTAEACSRAWQDAFDLEQPDDELIRYERHTIDLLGRHDASEVWEVETGETYRALTYRRVNGDALELVEMQHRDADGHWLTRAEYVEERRAGATRITRRWWDEIHREWRASTLECSPHRTAEAPAARTLRVPPMLAPRFRRGTPALHQAAPG